MKYLLPLILTLLSGCITLKNDLPFLTSLEKEAEEQKPQKEIDKPKPIGMLHWYMNCPQYRKTDKSCACKCEN
jgi:hypothetical protein